MTLGNKGLLNHLKFRTKYWQERQNSHRGTITNAIITGVQIKQGEPMPTANRQRENSRAGSPKRYLMSHSKEKRIEESRVAERTDQHIKHKLKKQLIQLDDEAFMTLQTQSRSYNVRTSRDDRGYQGYKGRTLLQRHRRGNNSLTLQVRPGSHQYRLKNRFDVVEKKHPAQFMTLHSSRYKLVQSPII